MITFEQDKKQFNAVANIKVIGIGGAGGNTVNSIIEAGCDGFECIVANTDSQALELSHADKKIQIGVKSTKGLGTGANPEVGERAAQEDLDKIMEAIGDADIVFIAAGMGGGTGSGGAPVVARALREKGILSIAIVTKPFLFEGKRRSSVADSAVSQLRKEVDTLIVIPNQQLLNIVDQNVSMIDAFGMINEVLGQSVRGISDIITKPGHINVDFADVRTIMRDRGMAVMGTGKAAGPQRAAKAAENAISSPLLENISIKGAHGVLLNITGGKNLGLHEISEAASIIYNQVHEDANIILGSVIDESLDEEVIVTIIATGCSKDDHELDIDTQDEPIQIKATIRDNSSEIKRTIEVKQEPIVEQKVQAQQEPVVQKEEPVIRIAPSETHQEVKEIKKVESLQANSSEKSVDVHDLDVPTFMRKQVVKQDNE